MIFIAVGAVLFFYANHFSLRIGAVNPIETRLKGKILLQVEQAGEAWYVNPANEERYYLGRPNDAFAIMRALAIGIIDEDLKKISIGNIYFPGVDSDGDGLANVFEEAIGTDINNKDTDGDGFQDGTEMVNNYNPTGAGKLAWDSAFAGRHAGKIFLQAQKNGEAWYVNPDNQKRYYLGRPLDAFNIMRSLGLGITDNDLEKIKINSEITRKIIKTKEQPIAEKPAAENKTDLAKEADETKNSQEKNVAAPKDAVAPISSPISSPTAEETKITAAAEIFNTAFTKSEAGAVRDLNIVSGLAINFEILKCENGWCDVAVKYSSMPNQKWLGQSMICKFDNTKDFSIAAQDLSGCQGGLYDLMRGK